MKVQMREPGFFTSLEVMEGAQEAIRELERALRAFYRYGGDGSADLIPLKNLSGCAHTFPSSTQ